MVVPFFIIVNGLYYTQHQLCTQKECSHNDSYFHMVGIKMIWNMICHKHKISTHTQLFKMETELVHNISVTLIVAWKLFEKVCGTKTSIPKYIYIKVLNDLHEYFFHFFFFLLKRQNSFFFIIVDSYIMRFLRVYTN